MKIKLLNTLNLLTLMALISQSEAQAETPTIFIGSTALKEFYVSVDTLESVRIKSIPNCVTMQNIVTYKHRVLIITYLNAIQDFPGSNFFCSSSLFGYHGLASLETEEEIVLVDKWFLETSGGNQTSMNYEFSSLIVKSSADFLATPFYFHISF